MTFSPRVSVVEPLPEPAMTMEELDQFSEKVAKETIQFLTYVVEEQLDDVYRLQSAMIEDNESLLGFSQPMVYMPSFKKNVEELKLTARRASKENRPKINDIIRLYEEKRIPNFLTAENAINRLAIQTGSKARQMRAQADYEKIMAKYDKAQPITGKLTR